MGNSFTSYARGKWTWAIGLFLLLLVSATAYGMVWYHRFYHHLTVQELSHEVQHSTFQTTIRGGAPVTLQIYQQSNAVNQPLVLFTSGDGGWSPLSGRLRAGQAQRVEDLRPRFGSRERLFSSKTVPTTKSDYRVHLVGMRRVGLPIQGGGREGG